MVIHSGSANGFAYISLKCECIVKFKKKEKLNSSMSIKGWENYYFFRNLPKINEKLKV